MTFGVVVLILLSGWALASIIVSLGVGAAARNRDTKMFFSDSRSTEDERLAS